MGNACYNFVNAFLSLFILHDKQSTFSFISSLNTLLFNQTLQERTMKYSSWKVRSLLRSRQNTGKPDAIFLSDLNKRHDLKYKEIDHWSTVLSVFIQCKVTGTEVSVIMYFFLLKLNCNHIFVLLSETFWSV